MSFYRVLGSEEIYGTPGDDAAKHVEVRAFGLTLGVSSVPVAREVHELRMPIEGAGQICW